jgi:hypothetical protein
MWALRIPPFAQNAAQRMGHPPRVSSRMAREAWLPLAPPGCIRDLRVIDTHYDQGRLCYGRRSTQIDYLASLYTVCSRQA